MHMWGDENVDWKGIDNASRYIGEGCRRWGRIQVNQYKEKFGTVRVYCHFGTEGLYWLLYPGWYHYKWPKWTRSINSLIHKCMCKCGFTRLLIKWQIFIYRLFYKRAIKKWPYLRKEILCCADYHELLKGL